MAESNFYVENPSNKQMHYGDKPIVGVVDFPDKLPVRRPYNYFEAQTLYNGIMNDVFIQQQQANPQKVKKGVPKIIKIALGAMIAAPFVLMGVKGVKKLITKLRH